MLFDGKYYSVKIEESSFDEQFFFHNFYKHKILKDPHLESVFLQIEREMRRMVIHNGKLCLNQSNLPEVRKHRTSTFDRMGTIIPVDIIKKMTSVTHIYEIRINEEYLKYRGLFFPYDGNSNYESRSIIFTFGFSKEDNKDDNTQSFTESSQCLRNNFYLGEIKAIEIGV